MGDSSCLLQDYSHAPEASNQDRDQVNLASALGGSISFGKYLSESLDWGKWSSFSHNRYLEEVEKYSKPGSVAQKKAYFEAHYKNMAARKSVSVLEHENAITTTAHEREANDGFSNDESHIDSSDPEVGSKEVRDIMTTSEAQEIATAAVDAGSSSSGGENHVAGTGQVEKAGQILEDEILKGSCSQIESSDIVEDVENQNKVSVIEPDTSSPSEKQPLKESFVTNKDSVDSVEMKSRGLVSKSSIRRSSRLPPSPATKLPFSPARTTPSIHRIKENNTTPSSARKRGMGSTETKKSTPKSLHMSINIIQYQGGATTTSESRCLSMLEKVANPKAAGVIPKASHECSHHFRTPTKASSNGVTKLVSLTPLSEHGRTKTPPEQSSFKKKIADLKLQTLSLDYPKSSSIKGHRQCSPLASSFSFKTQQRAEKRKELFHNLEDKFDKKGAKKLQLQETSKEKAESESRKLRQSLCFKARPLPEFYRNIEPPKIEKRKENDENELKKLHQSLCFKARPLPDFYHNIKPTKFDIKKIQLAQHQSPKHRRTSNSKADSELSNVPPSKPSFRSNRSISITEKNDHSETPTNL
uniref:Protein WVD2-like 7 isoform X1 n=1 Tax=Elaeis guineensis var. tenera TaxID=51953 RepID=A0A6I9RPW4_ELAGV|nr:protein WVD2-like 7 isoform X1 [Elaeis guineensis]